MKELKVTYYLRKEGFIHCALSFEGVTNSQKYISTGIRTTPENWDKETLAIRANNLENYKKNEVLQSFKTKLEGIIIEMKAKGNIISPEAVKAKFNGAKVETFAELLKAYFAHAQALFEAGRKQLSSVKNIKVKVRTFEKFLEWSGRAKLLLEEINHALIDDYVFYLQTQKKYADATWARHITEVECIVRYAVKKGFLPTNPIAYFKKPPQKQITTVFLTAQEIKSLQTCQVSHERLEKIRDLFIFQIFTGLSFVDLENAIKQNNTLIENPDSPYKYWLKGNRQKTGVHFLVPILPEAQVIIDKYEGINNLPIVNNGQYNQELKILGKDANIQPDKMRTHTARKTCGYMFLNNDVPIETVARVLGHASIKMTQRIYAQVLDRKIERDFLKFQQVQNS